MNSGLDPQDLLEGYANVGANPDSRRSQIKAIRASLMEDPTKVLTRHSQHIEDANARGHVADFSIDLPINAGREQRLYANRDSRGSSPPVEVGDPRFALYSVASPMPTPWNKSSPGISPASSDTTASASKMMSKRTTSHPHHSKRVQHVIPSPHRSIPTSPINASQLHSQLMSEVGMPPAGVGGHLGRSSTNASPMSDGYQRYSLPTSPTLRGKGGSAQQRYSATVPTRVAGGSEVDGDVAAAAAAGSEVCSDAVVYSMASSVPKKTDFVAATMRRSDEPQLYYIESPDGADHHHGEPGYQVVGSTIASSSVVGEGVAYQELQGVLEGVPIPGGPDTVETIERLNALFDKADVGTSRGGVAVTRADQILDRTELRHRLDMRGLADLLASIGVLAQFDTNGDGALDLDEVLRAMDTNGDGHVSRTEFIQTVLDARPRRVGQRVLSPGVSPVKCTGLLQPATEL